MGVVRARSLNGSYHAFVVYPHDCCKLSLQPQHEPFEKVSPYLGRDTRNGPRRLILNDGRYISCTRGAQFETYLNKNFRIVYMPQLISGVDDHLYTGQLG